MVEDKSSAYIENEDSSIISQLGPEITSQLSGATQPGSGGPQTSSEVAEGSNSS